MGVDHLPKACDLVVGSGGKKPPRPRKPSIRAMIAQAEKSGKNVASITTPEGVTLTFGEPVKDGRAVLTADNELEQWRRKKGHANQG
jgi:NAD(P)H-hydrate repair Nnr-like enzyme with NAD(P)H-hydrate epimerase domain